MPGVHQTINPTRSRPLWFWHKVSAPAGYLSRSVYKTKMNLFDEIGEEEINNLCAYVQRLFQRLKPILENIDPEKMSEKSKIEITPIKRTIHSTF